MSICWLPTTTGVGTYKFFTCTAFRALVRDHLWMLISKVLALASDWLRAILWYIVITLAFTAANTTRNWDGSGLWNCLIIRFMLFVPKIYKTFHCLLFICHIYVKVQHSKSFEHFIILPVITETHRFWADHLTVHTIRCCPANEKPVLHSHG